jgi:hypothetical protein
VGRFTFKRTRPVYLARIKIFGDLGIE